MILFFMFMRPILPAQNELSWVRLWYKNLEDSKALSDSNFLVFFKKKFLILLWCLVMLTIQCNYFIYKIRNHLEHGVSEHCDQLSWFSGF